MCRIYDSTRFNQPDGFSALVDLSSKWQMTFSFPASNLCFALVVHTRDGFPEWSTASNPGAPIAKIQNLYILLIELGAPIADNAESPYMLSFA